MKNRLLKRQYAVAVGKHTDYADLGRQTFKVIKNGMNYWAADPFPIEKDGTLYIFAEIFEYSKNKGSIGYTKLEKDKFTPWKIVIQESYHLSFPNLLYKDDELFMCPEANESGSIYLYKCIEFPEIWKKDRVLVSSGNYADTIFYGQNKETYGITFKLSDAGNRIELFKLHNSETVFSDMEVRSDGPDYTRPAGNIFYDDHNKCLLLPTQIGVPEYGSGIMMNEFSVDWPYMEIRPLGKIYPKDLNYTQTKDYVGIHTLNFTENYVVVDLKWYGFNAVNLFFKFLRWINRERERDGKR